MFVTPEIVELQLSDVYRKLGIPAPPPRSEAAGLWFQLSRTLPAISPR
jgi:hypothetical protein